MNAQGENLKTLRLKAGFTQTALADAIGWSQSEIGRLENGFRPVESLTVRRAILLARALDVAMDDLIPAKEDAK